MALVKKINGLHRIKNYQINIQFKRFVKTENFIGRKIDLSNNFSRHKLQAYMDLQAQNNNRFTNDYYEKSIQLVNSSIELINDIHSKSEYSYDTLDFTGVNNVIMEIPQIIMLVKEDNINYDKFLVEFYKKILKEEEEAIRNLNEKAFEDLRNISEKISLSIEIENSYNHEKNKIRFKKLILPTALIVGGLVIFYFKVLKPINVTNSTDNSSEVIITRSESSSIPIEENITYDAPSKIESYDNVHATDFLASEIKRKAYFNAKVVGQEFSGEYTSESTVAKLANMFVKIVIHLFQNS